MYKPWSQFEGRFVVKHANFEYNDGEVQFEQYVYIHEDRVDRKYFGPSNWGENKLAQGQLKPKLKLD